ncbi:MAG: tetratricopeptide repeat protein [bacterium JZ-2024 1]
MKDYFLRTEPFKEEVLEGQERKALLFSLAKKAFASVAEEKPLFFLISGYQNVDPLSQEFLFLFSYSLPRYPMCVLFTYTPGTEIPFRGKEFFTEISLKNWDIEEIEEAIKAFLVQMSGVKSFAYRILETTGGNPARVKSLLTYLQLSGIPKEGMGMMPEGKEQWEWLDITAQMDRLSPQAKEVLVIASILPEEFSYRHLKKMVPEGVDLDKALLELQEQEFLRETRFSPEPYYAFHIQEVRRFIQSQLLSDQSRSLHLRAAEALEKIYSEAGEEYFSQIACHYEKAGEPALAFQYYLKAGQSALEKSAIKEAKKLFNSARNMLNSLPSPPSTFLLEQFYQGYGEVEESLGNYTAAEEHYRKFQEMAVQSGNKEKEIRAVLKLGDIMLFKGGLTHAEKLFHQAKQMCEEGNFVSCKAFAVTKLGRVGYLKGYTEGVKENLLEGLQLAQESKDRKTEAMAHNYLGLFLRRSGSPYEALKHFETAYAIYQEMNYLAGMANTLLNIGIAYDHLRNLEKDMEVNQKALRMGEDIGDLYVIASASQNIGVMLLDAYGKPREALPYLMKGWEIHPVMGTLIPQIQDLLNLGECYLHLGEIEKENLSYQEGLKLAREVNSLYWIVETQISIAELYIYSGAYSDAENLLKQIWKESQSPGLESLSRKIELLLTWCFIEQEKWDEADALLRQNAEYFENLAKMQDRLKYFRLKSRLSFHNGNVNETREWLEKASHLAKNSGRIYENHLADVLLFHLLGEGSLSEVENFLKENDLPFLRLQKFNAQAHSAKKKKQEKLYQNIASEAKALLFSLAQKIEKTTLRESFLSAYLRLLQ